MLLKIPKSNIISKYNPLLSNLCKKIELIKELKNNYDKICISAFLTKTIESTTPSKINQYLIDYYKDIKKNDFSNFPVFYKEIDLKILKGTYFLSLIRTRKAIFEKEFKLLQKSKILSTDFELKDYIKSRLFTISHNFRIKNKKKENLSVLIPIADKINLSYNKNKINSEFSYSNGFFSFSAKKGISKGQEISMKNIDLSNSNLLLHYGHTIKNNNIPSDVFIEIKIKGNLDFNQAYEKTKIAPNLTTPNQKKNDNNVLSISKNIRVLLRHDTDYSKVIGNFRKLTLQNNSTSTGEPTDFENEAFAINLFKKALKGQTDKYENNLKSDLIIFNNKKNLTKRESDIYNVLIEEKKVNKNFYTF